MYNQNNNVKFCQYYKCISNKIECTLNITDLWVYYLLQGNVYKNYDDMNKQYT